MKKASVIIIGAGPVGIRAVEEISTLRPEISISIYGNEPHKPYNRVLLSNYLAGQGDFEAIKIAPEVQPQTAFTTHYHCAISEINPEKKYVKRADGETEYYDKLVLATGSHAHIPHLENADLEGIYTLRSIGDADRIIASAGRATVVLGGGLLGLETARAIQTRLHNEVTVIDHSLSLMSRQLNKEAGELLGQHVVENGLNVCLGNGVKEIKGNNGKLEAVVLRDDREIACDTLVFAVGIRPNIALAEQAGLQTRRGIVVNRYLQTSDPDIYAVGECAEFNRITYGIVAPGFEQARIMALNIVGKKHAYQGSILSTRLKVLDYSVFSMGQVGENEAGGPDQRISFEQKDAGIYRHIVIQHNRIIGCTALGEWTELSRIRAAIEKRKRIWPWELKRFRQSGLLWADKAADSVVYWPDNAVVCNCNQVNRGQLGKAVAGGCCSVAQLTETTQAGTTCGSCVSLLSELVGASIDPVKGFKTLGTFSGLALLAVMITILAPTVPYQQVATLEWYYDELWRDNYLKQVSGYVLLGCSIVVLTLSARKRFSFLNKGHFAGWRIMHVLIGFLTVAVLLAHTGFRMGHNLNFFLMLSFSGLLLVGAVAGGVIAVEHKLNPGLARKLRSQFVWAHILLFWPLPVLLGFHVLQTYYF